VHGIEESGVRLVVEVLVVGAVEVDEALVDVLRRMAVDELEEDDEAYPVRGVELHEVLGGAEARRQREE
jgi:hypothetical protein